MVKIFVSHSTQDRTYIAELERQIQLELGSGAEIFASSLPSAIPSGSAWFDTVMKALETADILILVKTRNTENSIWVGFELGYFWKKLNKQNIFILHHPKSRLLSPIDTFQAKSIFDEGQLANFFEELCKACGKAYSKVADISQLIKEANYLINPMAERSLERFEYLIEKSEWAEHSFDDLETTWLCLEDMLFQIVRNIDKDTLVEDFRESWANKFPNPHATSYRVNLKINGITIHQVVFVSLDGGRYFIPLPERKITYTTKGDEIKEIILYWTKYSIKYKLGKLIGRYYRNKGIEDFASQSNILIVDEPL